jgi:branched-chain amino acid transport system permease protein
MTQGGRLRLSIPASQPGEVVKPGTVSALVHPRLILWVVLFVAGFFVPRLITNPFYQNLCNEGLVLGIVAVATAFLMTQCNLVMFGVALFYGAPAYFLAILSQTFELSPLLAALVAWIVSIALALIVGAVVIRAKPLPFAMLTLAFGQMLRQVVVLPELRPLTGGEDGLSITFNDSFLGLSQADLGAPGTFWLLAWMAAGCVLAILYAVVRSRFGLILRAIRDNEERMRFSGFNTDLPRVGAFVLAAGVAAIGGLLHVLSASFVSPEALDFTYSGNVFAAVLIGGASGLIGPLVGSMVFTLGLDQFAASGHLQLFTGLALVIAIAFVPGGGQALAHQLWPRLFAIRRHGVKPQAAVDA